MRRSSEVVKRLLFTDRYMTRRNYERGQFKGTRTILFRYHTGRSLNFVQYFLILSHRIIIVIVVVMVVVVVIIVTCNYNFLNGNTIVDKICIRVGTSKHHSYTTQITVYNHQQLRRGY